MIAPTTSVHGFAGDKLFQITQTAAIPGNFARADLKFSAKKLAAAPLAGCGIYACFFDGALIYIGKFLGTRSQPFGGNVLAARWLKHIATLTLRGQQMSFSAHARQQILAHACTEAPYSELAAAQSATLLRDRGCLSTHNRFLFGAENWASFDALRETDLARFRFAYVQMQPDDGMTIADIRAHVSRSEDAMVRLFQPRANAVTSLSGTPSPTREVAVTEALQQALSSPMIQPQEPPMEDVAVARIAPTRKQASPALHHSASEPEDTSAHAMWQARMEGAPQAALGLIEKIHVRFDREHIELHYRFVPDLRLRSRNMHGKARTVGQNFARIRWQPKKKTFLVDIGLPTAELRTSRLPDVRSNRHGPLPTLIEIPADQCAASEDLILECLEQAHLRMIGDAGRNFLRQSAAANETTAIEASGGGFTAA